jgi:hypothetical protein
MIYVALTNTPTEKENKHNSREFRVLYTKLRETYLYLYKQL